MKIKGTKIITTLLTAVMLTEQITAAAPVHYVHAEGESENVNNDSETDSGNETSVPEGGMYFGDGYSVEVVVSDSWEGAYNVKLQISNTSEETIHNWGIIMKTSDMISGLYNAVELSEKDGMHLLKNAGYNQDIPAGGSVEAGYTAFYEGSFDVPQEFALSNIVKEVEMTECEVSLFITDEWEDGGMAQIIIRNISDQCIEDWMMEFDSTMDIADLWGGVIEGHDDEHYFIRNADHAQNIPAGETMAVEIVFKGNAADIRNVKLSQIIVGDMDNDSFVTPTPTPIADEEDVDYETDTDGDGIPDAYEEMIGTDLALTDTDSDRLDDYAEVFVLGSDPLVYDSIESGVADGDADSDGDGISNLQEINMGINPSLKDTDYDGLDDNEEIDIYGTDPADSDTDDDGLKDGDEIKLRLDPKDPKTNGIGDADYKISQSIDVDSDVLKQINTDDNGYLFSVEIKAAGYVEGNIKVVESDHAYVMQNDAMLGKALQLKYDMDNTVEKVTLHFEIDDQYVSGESTLYPDAEELRGIHRYNVFHYFEDRNMLLPVETFFDDEGNTVYAETDELGTYCLMDMEKIFERLDSISVMGTDSDGNAGKSISETSKQDDTAEMQMTIPEYAKEMSGITSNNISVDDDIPVTKTVPEGDGRQLVNLYFILFRAGESDWIYEKERDLIPEVLEKLQENNNDYRFRAIVLFHDKCWDYYHAGLLKWYEDPNELKDMLMEMDYYSHYNGYVDYDDAGSILRGLLKEQIKDNPDSLNFAYNCTSTHMWCSRHISRPYSIYEDFVGKVVYSDIGKYLFQYEDYDETSEYPTFVEKTGGKRWLCEGDMVKKVYEHIMGTLPAVTEGGDGGDMPIPSGGEGGDEDNEEDKPEEPQSDTRTEYPAITLTGWNIIKLDAPLVEGSDTDTDEDGLTDWQEVDTRLLTMDNGEYVLPTINECINDVDKPYVRDGMKRFGESLSSGEDSLDDLIRHYKTARILPILSDPTQMDSDGDTIRDIYDKNRLEKDDYTEEFNKLVDKGIVNPATIYQTDDGFTLCTTSLYEIYKGLGYPDDSLYSYSSDVSESVKDKLSGPNEYYIRDWYFFAISESIQTEYGLICLRPHREGLDQECKVSIPFVNIDVRVFIEYDSTRTEEVKGYLSEVTNANRDTECSRIIAEYFASAFSKANYLIADEYIKIILNDESNSNVDNDTISITAVIPRELKSSYRDDILEEYASRQCEDSILYDPKSNTLNIPRGKELSDEEKRCIIACRTNNPSLNSFAAEIIFHAEQTIESKVRMTWGYPIEAIISYEKVYGHAIKADLSLDDEDYAVIFHMYKDFDGWYVKKQRSIFGNI